MKPKYGASMRCYPNHLVLKWKWQCKIERAYVLYLSKAFQQQLVHNCNYPMQGTKLTSMRFKISVHTGKTQSECMRNNGLWIVHMQYDWHSGGSLGWWDGCTQGEQSGCQLSEPGPGVGCLPQEHGGHMPNSWFSIEDGHLMRQLVTMMMSKIFCKVRAGLGVIWSNLKTLNSNGC